MVTYACLVYIGGILTNTCVRGTGSTNMNIWCLMAQLHKKGWVHIDTKYWNYTGAISAHTSVKCILVTFRHIRVFGEYTGVISTCTSIRYILVTFRHIRGLGAYWYQVLALYWRHFSTRVLNVYWWHFDIYECVVYTGVISTFTSVRCILLSFRHIRVLGIYWCHFDIYKY